MSNLKLLLHQKQWMRKALIHIYVLEEASYKLVTIPSIPAQLGEAHWLSKAGRGENVTWFVCMHAHLQQHLQDDSSGKLAQSFMGELKKFFPRT